MGMLRSEPMVAEARLEDTEHGMVAASDGWFVLNAHDGRWRTWGGLGARLSFEAETKFPQVGINLYVLAPGQPMGMYHREADQEDFLVLAGEPLLIVEGAERVLRQWDFVHCPPGTEHMIVGAGAGGSVVLAVGARQHQDEPDWGRYIVNQTAQRHGASVEHETSDPDAAYARLPAHQWTKYRAGWLGED